ncbi:MAG: sulfotransferase [Opitutaceae bacterium]|nr:sulfotransferase [Opitutaceae bacterium]
MTGALPFRLDFEAGEPLVEWIATDGSRFTEPFFEETLARLRRGNPANARTRRSRTPLNALRDVAPGVPLAALIFHVSRCGSTLLAQMLAALPRNLVASEPQIIDEILRLNQRVPEVNDDDRIAWLRGAVHALGQRPADGGERLFVKLACWHVFSLPLIQRAFPGVPMLFVFRDPVEVLVSLMRMPSLAIVRDTVTPGQLGLTTAIRDALSREEHAAAVLGALFRAAREHRDALVPVDYERLPEVVWEVIPGCSFTGDERARLQAAAAFDAKNPAQRFTPDTAAKRKEASPAILAAVARWAEPHYARWLAVL